MYLDEPLLGGDGSSIIRGSENWNEPYFEQLWSPPMGKHQILEKSESISDLLAALGNNNRLQIVSHLFEGECSVGSLANKVGLSQSALSQHLSKLRARGLVTTRRDGQTIYYSMRDRRVESLLSYLDDIFYLDKPGTNFG
jgi:DNA-binding transcriptional ArsR family regulator